MNTSHASWLPRLYHWAFLSVIAVLPISHTTGLRNLLLVFLLALLAIHAVRERHVLPELWRKVRPVLPWPLGLWFVFLLLFPLWAVYPDEAWANLRGQWGQSMLAWLIGFGAVWVMGARGPGLWALALASAFPLALHLLVTLAAWAGLLGRPIPTFLTFQDVASRLRDLISGQVAWTGPQALPLPFSGVEDMHGNLGYAAGQAIALLCVLLLMGWRERKPLQFMVPAVVIALCLVSLLVASSRGGLLYAVILVLIAALIYRFRLSCNGVVSITGRVSAYVWIALLGVTVLVSGLAWRVVSTDLRWQTMLDKVQIGLSQEDPIQVLCEGLSPEQKQQIRQIYSHRAKAYVDELIAGLKGQDGGRMLLMRAGIELVLENPRGQDGSRGSYQKLIEKKCGHVPELTFAHLHQSWMDLALSLGWLGAGLFAWLLLSFVRDGWRAISPGEAGTWGYALLLIASFWFLRGFADSLYREHYLQMQAMLMAYLYGRMFLTPVKAVPGAGRLPASE